MAKGKGLPSKLAALADSKNLQPLTAKQQAEEQGILGAQFGEQSTLIDPLIQIEDNYAKYMGAPRILSQGLEDDLREIRAQNQSFGETAARGLGRFALETGVHALGNITAPISFILSGGTYDNEWNRMIDDAAAGVKELMPIYKTKAQQEADFFSAENLLSDNFWFDDFAGGLSFIAGSYLSGMALGAIGRAGNITQRLMKSSKALKRSVDATKTAELIRRRGRQIAAGQLIGNTVFSSYEAGLQAREFKELAMQELQDQYLLENNKPAGEKDLEEFRKEVNKVANGVFAANIVLTSMENVVMLNKIYGKPLNKLMPKVFTKPKIGVDGKILPKSRFRHVTGQILKTVYTPLFEGSQELAQSLVTQTGIEYVMAKYSPDSHLENMDLTGKVYDAFNRSWNKALDSDGGLNEAYIGMLMGAIGLPFASWGSISEIPGIFKKPQLGKFAIAYNAYNKQDSANIMKNMSLHMSRILETNKEQERSVTSGDMLQAKDEEAKQILSWMSSRDNVRMLDDEIDDYINTLEKMDYDEFVDYLGYTPEQKEAFKGRKDQELAARKKELIDGLLRHKRNFQYANDLATGIATEEGEEDLHELIAYNVFMNENAKDRVKEIESRIKENTGVDVQDMYKFFSRLGQPETKMSTDPDIENPPQSFIDYIEQPGNYANLAIELKDHRRLVEKATDYNSSIKAFYDIENKRKMINLMNYMKYSLFRKFGVAVDIAESQAKEFMMYNKVKQELLDEILNYEGLDPLIDEVNNEIDYVNSRMDDLKGKINKKFASKYMKTVERMNQIRDMINELEPEREKYERRIKEYTKFDRGPHIIPVSYGDNMYTDDIDNNDNIKVPAGGTLESVERDPETGRPVSYSYKVYDEKTETVTEKFFHREHLGGGYFVDRPGTETAVSTDTLVKDPAIKTAKTFNILRNRIRKVLQEQLGISDKDAGNIDVDGFLEEYYGISEDNYLGLEAISVVIKNGNEFRFFVNTVDQGTVLISMSNNEFANVRNKDGKVTYKATTLFENQLKKMFGLRNKYNEKSKVIYGDKINLNRAAKDFNFSEDAIGQLQADGYEFADNTSVVIDFKDPNNNIESIRIITEDTDRLQVKNGQIKVPAMVTVVDPDTKVATEIVVNFFFPTTDDKPSTKGDFSKSQRMKEEALNRYKMKKKRMEQIKEEMNRIKKGSGHKGFKVGDKIDDCN